MRSKNIDEHLRASTESAQILARAQAKRQPLERSLHEKRAERDRANDELRTIEQSRQRRHATLTTKGDEVDTLRRAYAVAQARAETAVATLGADSRSNQSDDARLALARAQDELDRLERSSARADETDRTREDALHDLVLRNSQAITTLETDLQKVTAVERAELAQLGEQMHQLGISRIETTGKRYAEKQIEVEQDRRLHEATINDVISSLEPWPEFQNDIRARYAPELAYENAATKLIDAKLTLLEALKDRTIPQMILDQVFAVQESYFMAYPGSIDGVLTTLRLAKAHYVQEQQHGRRA